MDIFAVAFIALYIGHDIGDYWVQSHHDALSKQKPGSEGRAACIRHVSSYLATQCVILAVTWGVLNIPELSHWKVFLALSISCITHYLADRGPNGPMFKLAQVMSWKRDFLALGRPRGGHYDDNPQLATGAWALDQTWHRLFGVFIPALVLAI